MLTYAGFQRKTGRATCYFPEGKAKKRPINLVRMNSRVRHHSVKFSRNEKVQHSQCVTVMFFLFLLQSMAVTYHGNVCDCVYRMYRLGTVTNRFLHSKKRHAVVNTVRKRLPRGSRCLRFFFGRGIKLCRAFGGG